MDIKFYQDILKSIGANVTCQKMLFFYAWRTGESSKSSYNPFAITQPNEVNEGCYYNCLKSGIGYTPVGCRECPSGTSPGVRNYKTYESGLKNTVNTLTNGRYNKVVTKLKNDNITAEEIASENSELKTWGTGGLVLNILKYSEKIKPTPISKYGDEPKYVLPDDEDIKDCVRCTPISQNIKYNENINQENVNDFRWWVNQDNDRLKQVTDKFKRCCETKKDLNLNMTGKKTLWTEIAFSVVGNEWINSGKPSKPKVRLKKVDKQITLPENVSSSSPPQKNRWGKPHHGYDITGPYSGNKCLIVCNKAGTVTYAMTCTTYGNIVEIKHSDGVYSAYAHLHKIYVKKGEKIKVGDVIGVEGNTGKSDGRHLHFEERVPRPKGFKNRCGEGSPYNEVKGWDTVKPKSILDNYFYFQEGE